MTIDAFVIPPNYNSLLIKIWCLFPNWEPNAQYINVACMRVGWQPFRRRCIVKNHISKYGKSASCLCHGTKLVIPIIITPMENDTQKSESQSYEMWATFSLSSFHSLTVGVPCRCCGNASWHTEVKSHHIGSMQFLMA